MMPSFEELRELDLDGWELPIGRIMGKASLVEGEWRALVVTHDGSLILCEIKIKFRTAN